MHIQGLRKNKRGFSLIELVVAIAVMSIISATLSMILGNTLTLYNRGENTSVLYNVSQKIHDSLNRELTSCQSLVLYESASSNTQVKDNYQARLYLSEGRILKYSRKNDKEEISEILLSEKSYRGCEVQSFVLKYDSVEERFNYFDTETRKCFRILYITTVLMLNGQTYEHTSTVRLYNMCLYEASNFAGEIELKLKDKSNIIVANNNYKKREFASCIYTYPQNFSVA